MIEKTNRNRHHALPTEYSPACLSMYVSMCRCNCWLESTRILYSFSYRDYYIILWRARHHFHRYSSVNYNWIRDQVYIRFERTISNGILLTFAFDFNTISFLFLNCLPFWATAFKLHFKQNQFNGNFSSKKKKTVQLLIW